MLSALRARAPVAVRSRSLATTAQTYSSPSAGPATPSVVKPPPLPSTLRGLLSERTRQPHVPLSVPESDTVLNAMHAMQGHRFRLGSILCTRDGASSFATGIVTERDYITKVASKSLDPRTVRCSQVLTKPVMCAPAGISILEGAQLLSQQRIRHLPVLDDAAAVGARDSVPLSSILGMLSVKDFLRFIHSTHGNWPTPTRNAVEITVQDLLSHQPKPVVVMSPSQKVLEAVQQMAAASTGVVLVQDNASAGFRGILTERDVIFKVELQGKSTADTPIGDIMTRDPIVASPSFSWESVIELMVTGSRDGRLFRHLPVVESEGRRTSRSRCLGVITVRQLLAVWLKKIAPTQ